MSMSMNAKEAREMTIENVMSKIVQPHIQRIDAHIRFTAQSGEYSIEPWFWFYLNSLGMPITVEQEGIITKHYRNLGFKIEYLLYPNQEFGGSRRYTVLSW